jgi:hypothetical protein
MKFCPCFIIIIIIIILLFELRLEHHLFFSSTKLFEVDCGSVDEVVLW